MPLARLCAVLLSILLLTNQAVSRTWHISPDGTGDAPTIQAGIDSAVAGDTVSLRNGVFTGVGNRAVEFRGKAILVCSESGIPDSCVIDCEGADRAFLFVGGEGRGSVLRMVQVTRGWKYDRSGGAIYCEDSPSFVGCLFRDNSCGMYGGAVYSLGSPAFSSCVFEGNEAPYGGAVYCKGVMETLVPEFVECAFVENRAGIRGGAAYLWFSRSLFDRCRFTMNASVDRGAQLRLRTGLTRL